jgi:hypothetical protein
MYVCVYVCKRDKCWSNPCTATIADILCFPVLLIRQQSCACDEEQGSLFRNTRWIYVTLLQLIISWIYVWCFSNHSPGLSGYKCFLLYHNTVLLVSWHQSVTAHSCHVTITARFTCHFHLTVISLVTVLLIISTLGWLLAGAHIYIRTQTRLQAVRKSWIGVECPAPFRVPAGVSGRS